MLAGRPASAMCVQESEDSRSSAIRSAYRILLRSSSISGTYASTVENCFEVVVFVCLQRNRKRCSLQGFVVVVFVLSCCFCMIPNKVVKPVWNLNYSPLPKKRGNKLFSWCYSYPLWRGLPPKGKTTPKVGGK